MGGTSKGKGVFQAERITCKGAEASRYVIKVRMNEHRN